MEEKIGERVESIKHTFGRNESGEVVTNVSYSVDCNIEPHTEYVIDIVDNGRTHVDTSKIEPFKVRTHNESNNTFNIPKRIIDKYGIRPGHNVKINIYEPVSVEDEQTTSNNYVIGRATANKRSGGNGCASTLNNKSASDHIDKNGTVVRFRNLENGKEAIGESHSDLAQNKISFPANVSEKIDASPQDLIEIIAIDEESKADEEQLPEEKIDELYEMVSELYEAYTAANND